MAVPPFNLDIPDPTDTSIVAQFPANERTFRDNLNSYINTEHDITTGHHALLSGSSSARDGNTWPTSGSLWFNTDFNRLQFRLNSVWQTVDPFIDSIITLNLSQTLTASQSGALILNTLTGLTFTLPAAAPGLVFAFQQNQPSDTLTIQRGGSDTIVIPQTTGSANVNSVALTRFGDHIVLIGQGGAWRMISGSYKRPLLDQANTFTAANAFSALCTFIAATASGNPIIIDQNSVGISGNNGTLKLPSITISGTTPLTVQWGITSGSTTVPAGVGNFATFNISFNTAFSNACQMVVAIPYASSGGGCAVINSLSTSSASGTLINVSNAQITMQIAWIAIGY